MHFLAVVLLDGEAEVVDIIWGLHAWLKEHPHETIFVSLKVDNGSPIDPAVQDAMGKVLQETNDFWVEDPSPVSISDWVSGGMSNSSFQRTTLGDARGKLVLVRRFPFPRTVGYGVSENWTVNGKCFEIPLNEEKTSVAWIEDFYLLKGQPKDAAAQIKKKQAETIKHLDKAQTAIVKNPTDLYITFASAVGDRAGGKVEENVTPRVGAPAFSLLSRSLPSGHGSRSEKYHRCEPASHRLVSDQPR
jgi:1-phosphatidylinositol phosphodiesterase